MHQILKHNPNDLIKVLKNPKQNSKHQNVVFTLNQKRDSLIRESQI